MLINFRIQRWLWPAIMAMLLLWRCFWRVESSLSLFLWNMPSQKEMSQYDLISCVCFSALSLLAHRRVVMEILKTEHWLQAMSQTIRDGMSTPFRELIRVMPGEAHYSDNTMKPLKVLSLCSLIKTELRHIWPLTCLIRFRGLWSNPSLLLQIQASVMIWWQ